MRTQEARGGICASWSSGTRTGSASHILKDEVTIGVARVPGSGTVHAHIKCCSLVTFHMQSSGDRILLHGTEPVPSLQGRALTFNFICKLQRHSVSAEFCFLEFRCFTVFVAPGGSIRLCKL